MNKALENYKAFLNEIEMVKEIEEFAPKLEKLFSSSFSAKDILFLPIYLTLGNNYNNLYNAILKIQRHMTELFAWMKVYEKENDEKQKYVILAEEIEDSLILISNSIYSFKEKVIYAIVVTSWMYQHYFDKPIEKWKLDEKSEREINIRILKEHFSYINEVKKILPKIDKIHVSFHTKPLDFRPKSTHRITPGIEKFGGQQYLIKNGHIRFNFGPGESIKLEETKPKIKQSYSDCLDLFYEFENYCVNYLKVKEKIKPERHKIKTSEHPTKKEQS